MSTTNYIAVRTYYKKNKTAIAYRKARKRCVDHGAVPTVASFRRYGFQVHDFRVALAEFSSHCEDDFYLLVQLVKIRDVEKRLLRFIPRTSAARPSAASGDHTCP